MSLEVLYANSSHYGGKYVREAVQSAQSFRRFLPEAKYVLYTDLSHFSDPAFDTVVSVPYVVPEALKDRRHFNGQLLVKITAMLERESEEVLVLGSDTYALRPGVRDLPRVLETFDIAVAHAPARLKHMLAKVPQVPHAFPEFNCDFILYRNTEKVREALAEWRERYVHGEFGHPHDQGAFRYVMFFSGLRIATLPPEYNYRGWDVREDTVVLQRRELLPKYLARDRMHRRLLRRAARKAAPRPVRALARRARARLARRRARPGGRIALVRLRR